MNDLWSPSFLANPTHRRQGAGLRSVATHVASAKSADTMSVVLGAVELNGELIDDCGTDHVFDD